MSRAEQFPPLPFAWFEGDIIPVEEAKLPITTNALNYGTALVGGIRVFDATEGPAVFRLEDHVNRLQNGVETLGFPFDFDHEEITEAILSLARANKAGNTSYIRPMIYRSDTNFSPGIQGEYKFAAHMRDVPNYFDPNRGLRVVIPPWRRPAENAIPPSAKIAGSYINSALADEWAKQQGFDSAVMLNSRGEVSEGPAANVFLVGEDGKLVTPSPDSDILEGITRRTVIEIANEVGICVVERRVEKEELNTAQEVFFTGTAAGIAACSSVGEVEISQEPGPITEELRRHYQSLAETRPELFTPIADPINP